MKKWIFLFVMLLMPMVLLAQEPEVPEDIAELLANLQTFLGSLAGLAGTTIFVAAVIIKAVQTEKRWVKLVIGFLTAIVLSALTNLANFGLFAETAWLDTLLYGAGIGFVAGSLVDIPTMKILVELILQLVRFKKPVE